MIASPLITWVFIELSEKSDEPYESKKKTFDWFYIALYKNTVGSAESGASTQLSKFDKVCMLKDIVGSG